MKNKNLIYFIVGLYIALFMLGSCSTPMHEHYAIRIRPEKQSKYENVPNATDPRRSKRNPSTLRGQIFNVERDVYPIRCDSARGWDTVSKVVFWDENLWIENHRLLDHPNYGQLEKIPIDDIELMGQKAFKSSTWNRYKNINLFEYWFNPLSNYVIKEVPVVTRLNDTCNQPPPPPSLPCDSCLCNCGPIDLNLMFYIKCPCENKEYSWYFLEFKGGYGLYSDIHNQIESIGRDKFFGEFSGGLRFDRFALGITYNTGIPIYNRQTNEDVLRPLALLYGRLTITDGKCLRPFLYGQLGTSLDRYTLNHFGQNYESMLLNSNSPCSTCLNLGFWDFTLPISLGLGVGIDFPLSCSVDLSFDIGYKSVAIREPIQVPGIGELPATRRIGVWLARFGLAF